MNSVNQGTVSDYFVATYLDSLFLHTCLGPRANNKMTSLSIPWLVKKKVEKDLNFLAFDWPFHFHNA